MKTPPVALAAALVALAGCSGSNVQVRPSGADLHLKPKPSNCGIEFLQKSPGRPFDEIAELTTHLTNPPPGDAAEALRPKACELGADAVIVTRNFVTNEFGHVLVAGTAIRWTEAAPPEGAAPAPAPAR